MKLSKTLIAKTLLIRRVEERLLKLFSEGLLNGTVHTCSGQEWSGVAVCNALTPEDAVFSNHRGHGHYLARTDDAEGLIAEVMGRESGVCHGVGGTQHLCRGNFFSSGIQGGMIPSALGWSLSNASRPGSPIATVFIGDGTLGEGLLYESLNIASLWKLPVLFVVENNGYAQSTDTSTTISGSIKGRADAFGIPYLFGETALPESLLDVSSLAVSKVRSDGPALLEIKTYRLNAHSKGDDLRSDAERAAATQRDPVSILLASEDIALKKEIEKIVARIEEAVSQAKNSPITKFIPKTASSRREVSWRAAPLLPTVRGSDQIHSALSDLLTTHQDAYFIGEDIEGPYGGAFKVSKDLSIKFQKRVKNTPISEAALIGIGNGIALSGAPAIVEIMFGDFLTLALDQLQQHAAKFVEMYGETRRHPLIVRTPMGGGRGYGPTHSQSIERFFLGIPGLNVVALNARVDPKQIFPAIMETGLPTVLIENKILYTKPLRTVAPLGYEVLVSDERLPTVKLRPLKGVPQVTVVVYGQMLDEVETALVPLFREHEILAEIIVPTALTPLNIEPILASVKVTNIVCTIEEGSEVHGFGSECMSSLHSHGARITRSARIGYGGLIPASFQREQELRPSSERIVSVITKLLKENI